MALITEGELTCEGDNWPVFNLIRGLYEEP